MGFLTEKQRKEMNVGFFKWIDGSKLKVKVKNVSEERFSDGKTELLLDITNVENGDKWEKVKYQFDFVRKLDAVAEYQDENTVLEVCPKIVGQKPNAKDPSKPYDVWDFIITVVGQDAPAAATDAASDPGF